MPSRPSRRWRARVAGAIAAALVSAVAITVLPATQSADAAGTHDLYPSATGDTGCGMAGASQTASATTDHDTSVSYSNASGPNSSCRYLIEWRSGRYGPTDGTTIPRRSLFWVYAKAGEYILMGSSELQATMGASQANIDLWDPERPASTDGATTHVDLPNPILDNLAPGAGGTNHPNLDEWTNQQLEDTVDWRCTAGGTTEGGVQYTDYDGSATAGSRVASTNNGILNSRAKENAGAYGTDNTAGYTPCVFRAPHDGAYAIGFIGYAGPLDNTDMTPPGSGTEIAASPASNYFIQNPTTFAPIGSGNVTRAWDVTVRTDPSLASTDQSGRLFTYALAGWVGQPFYPLDVTYWLTTQDGFRYRVKTNGITPVGFVLFGNDEGFLNDDGSPLHHDVFAADGLGNTPSAMLQGLTGNTGLDEPLYPMSFSPANGGALADDTLNYLHIPLQPQAPVLTGLTYTGAIGGNETYGGVGGTFYASTAGRGTIMIVIASRTKDANDDGDCTDAGDAITESDAAYWDPTNPCNSTVYADSDGPETSLPIPWYGKDNKGDAFVIGDDFPVLATLRGGEYHMPMFDLEGSVWGSPTFTMVNAPDITGDGISDCPTFYAANYDYAAGTGAKIQSCSQAFFDDRGYKTALGDVSVGTVGDFICPAGNQLGLEPNSQSNDRAQDGALDAGYGETRYASDPLLGFNSDTERRVRAFGAAASGVGAATGTWTVNNNVSCANGNGTRTPLGDAAGLELWTFYPSVTRKTGDPDFPAPDVTVIPKPIDAVDDGPYTVTNDTNSHNGTAPVTDNDLPDPLPAHTCQFATGNASATPNWSNSGVIYNAAGTAVGTIALRTATTEPCDYTYQFTPTAPAQGSYYARYRLSNGTDTDIAYVTFNRGTVAIPDFATTYTGGASVNGNVMTNDLCTGGTNSVNWNQGDWVATPAQPYGAASPANGTQTAVNGAWQFTPNSSFSGTLTRSYQTNRTGTCNNRIASVTVTVVPVAVPDTSTGEVNTQQTGNAVSNDRGLSTAGAPIDAITGVDLSAVPVGGSFVAQTNGTWTFTPPTDWTGVFTVPYSATGAGGTSPASFITVRVTPRANDDASTYAINTTNTGNVLANDHGSGLTAAMTGTPSYSTPCPACTLSIDANGTYHFAPGSWSGIATVQYTATDSSGQTTTATLTLTDANYLHAVDDGPYQVAVDASWYASTGPTHPAGQEQLTWNDVNVSGNPLSCLLAADAAGTSWASAGGIYDSLGNAVGDIELVPGGADCDYRYRFANGTPHGAYTAKYQVSNGIGTSVATVTFTQGANDDLASTTTGGSAVGGDVLSNDECGVAGSATADWLGDWAAVPNQPYGAIAPANGPLTAQSGAWSYTPNATFSGVISRYYLTDRADACDNLIAQVRISVAPVATADSSTNSANVQQSGSVLANDHGLNASGGAIDAVADIQCLDAPAVCAGLALSTDGTWTYLPPTDWSGTVDVQYRASGAGGVSAPTTLTIHVLPIAQNDSGTFLVGQPSYGNVLLNDAGTSLAVTSTGTVTCSPAATPCALTIAADGSFAYTPPTGWVGTITAPYTATDAEGQTTSATLTLVGSAGLNAVDDGPYPLANVNTWYVANGVNVGGTTQNSAANHPNAQRQVTWNDTFTGTPTCAFATNNTNDATALTWAAANAPGNIYNAAGTDVGDIQLLTGTSDPCDYEYRITTTNGTYGSYFARYKLSDSTGDDWAFVIIDRGTVAVTDTGTTATGGSAVSGTSVLTNDVCQSGGSASANWNNGYTPSGTNWTITPNVGIANAGTIAPANGNINGSTGNPSVAWSYTPNTTFSGVLVRAYQTDHTTGCNNRVADLIIVVKPTAVNDSPPSTVAGPATQSGNVLTNDMGRNAAGNQIDVASNVTCLDPSPTVCGWLTMTNGGNGAWTFNPADTWSGIVQVRYTATGAGGTSLPAYLTIRVTPVAAPDTGSGLARDAGHPQPAITGNVLGNDIGGRTAGALTVVSHGSVAHGTLTLDADGSYVYTPQDGWSGQEVVSYTIADGDGQTTSSTLTLTTVPVGIDDEASTEPVTPVTGNVLTNDIAAAPQNAAATSPGTIPGTFSMTGAGAWSFTPAAGANGDIAIPYSARDGSNQAYSATLVVHIPRRIEILKQGENELAEWVPMDGSAWAIYTDAALTTEVPGHPIVSTSTGLFQVDGLPDGTYWLVETQALAGFALLAEPVEFTVGPTGTVTIASGGSADVTAAVVGNVWRITVNDVPSLALPDAGGPGTAPYLVSGAAIIAAALAAGFGWLLHLRRRPKGRHAASTTH